MCLDTKHMKKILLGLLVVLASVCNAKEKPQAVIVILADDLGYGDLSCYGAEKIQTPNIDKLAGAGTLFTDAHSSSAVCTPSRYSLLTGRYCWRTRLKKGVIGGFDEPLIESERPTLATLFKNAGYKTAAIGKWHLGMSWQTTDGKVPQKNGYNVDYSKPLKLSPVNNGFDYYFGISASLDFPPYCFIENHKAVGKVNSQKKVRYDSQRQGMQAQDWDDLVVDSLFFEKAVNYIKTQAEADEQFFLYLATPAPHRPCVPPAFIENQSEAGRRGDMVALFDWGIGKIMQALKDNGLDEKSMVVITSDNGARPGDGHNPMDLKFYHGTTQLPNRDKPDVFDYGVETWSTYGHKSNGKLRGYKTDIYEGGHRIPLVVYSPGLKKHGQQINQTVCLTDWYASFAELLNAKTKTGGEDSKSIFPLLEHGKESRQYVVHHSARGMFSIRYKNWKYVEGKGSGGVSKNVNDESPEQLYNLAQDPMEQNNVLIQNQSIAEKLKTKLQEIKQNQ